MPDRPQAPCTTPGCRNVTPAGGRCADCRDRRGAIAEARRPSADRRGYDRRWSQIRTAFLVTHPWCVLCKRAATVADHHPVSRRDLVAAGVPDPDAPHWLRPLCASCHNRSTARHQGGGWNRPNRRPA